MKLLGDLYGPHMSWVYAVCMAYLKNSMDAEDATVQIFEKLSKELRKHEVQHFKSWLHSLVRNHCLMTLRQRREVFVPIEESFSLPIMDSEEDLHLENRTLQLSNCIEGLKTEQKRAIELFYFEKKCYQEIGEVLSFDWKKTKSVIQNARRMLKVCLESK